MTTSSTPLGGQQAAAFPKRFYKEASVVPEAGGFALRLDNRPARTPSRSPVLLPTEAFAAAVADEWAAVETVIDPRQMPLTRLVNSVIDGVSRTEAEVRAEILRYAGSDLLAYRAGEPQDLVRLQRASWEPILAWATERFGAAMRTGEGVMFVEQPPELPRAARRSARLRCRPGCCGTVPARRPACHDDPYGLDATGSRRSLRPVERRSGLGRRPCR